MPNRLPSLVLVVAACGATRADSPATFADVHQLLQARCAKCHGEKVRKADLDLTTPAGLLKGGKSGKVVVPGKPDESPLFEKVHSGAMPPKKEGGLAAAEVDLIRRWIAAGAIVPEAEPRPAALTQHDVLPILLRRCPTCHGAHRREGDLDLRTRAAMLRGGKSGPAIVPGQPEKSRLIEKV